MALKSYEELIKVDVRQYCEERDGFTYLNWAKCIELLRQNGATEVYWEPIPDPQTGSSLRKTDIEFKDKNNNTNRCYETEAKKHNIQEEAEYNRQIKEIYANMMDEINKEINGFYTKYAAKEGITMAEAKKRVSKLDIAAYERKAKKYVETKDLSDRANEEMRIYNLTMKVNRLELLKANIGLEMVSGFDEMQKYFDKKLTDRTLKEFQRQAGILGKSVLKNEKYAHAIVNASFKNATYSDRIWMYQGMLKAELEGLLASGLIRGQNPKKLAKHLEKRFGVSAYNAQRLMTTELARVQTEAQKQSFIRNGFDEYVYVACTKGDVCPICKGLDDKHFKVDDMMPGENAPPMHPGCHCSVAAYMDDELYEEWINSYQEHGLNFETWKQLHEEETYESEMGRRLVNRITGISKQKKIFNEGLKTTSNEDVKTLLKQSLGRTEIARLSGRKSYYSAKEKKIYLSKDAKSDTIAHELFHEIDDTYALVENGMLKNSVQQDYRRLQNQAKRYGKSIEEMLYLEYPEAFEVSKYGIKFKEEYRGISDILNGMSNGDILMGYSHKTDYWKKSGRLEKESWAQYGRMFYTDGKALEMAKKIFPEMSQEIEQRIRRLMK